MQQPLKDLIAAFDPVLEHYQKKEFGSAGRTQCHQTSKIAAYALASLLPKCKVRTQRVELAAMMQGAARYVSVGALDDTRFIKGKLPMHFLVLIGDALYDPTFSQLALVETPLDLPPEPYFFVEDCLRQFQPDADGFRWMGKKRPTGMLGVGYKLLDVPLPPKMVAQLMPNALARLHGERVAARYKQTSRT